MAARCGRAARARAPARWASLALAPPSRVVDAFRSALGDLGHVDGRTAVLESRFSGDRYERLPALAAELVRLDGDVLVAAPAPAVIAATAASGTIPIVTIGVADPVGQGLVASLARPAGT
jgi:putative tryptophan/tyrosine transport system substrate-binding protein